MLVERPGETVCKNGVAMAMSNDNKKVGKVHLVNFLSRSCQDIRIKLYSLLRRLGGTKKDIRAAYRSIIYNINGHHDSKAYRKDISLLFSCNFGCHSVVKL